MFCKDIIIKQMDDAIAKQKEDGMDFYMKNGTKVYMQTVKKTRNGEFVKVVEFDNGDGFTANNTYVNIWQGGEDITHYHFNMFIPYDEISFVGTYADDEE